MRDAAGRFAKVGARVQGKNGGLGWVTGHRGDQALVTTDDGRELLLPSKQFDVATVPGRARMEQPPKVIDDPSARLDSYLEWAQERLGVTAAGIGPSSGGSGAEPLFMAEVDSVDTTAVLALLAVVPTDQGKGLRIFERRDARWVEAPDYVRSIRSVNPPSLVELDRETLLMVVEQLDTSDSKKAKEKASGGSKEESPESSAAPAGSGGDGEGVPGGSEQPVEGNE